MSDDIKKCALCGVKEVPYGNIFFCVECGSSSLWQESEECHQYRIDRKIGHFQDFVRRVRRERCQRFGETCKGLCHNVVKMISREMDCYGCAAYAPREVSGKDCKTCIHSNGSERPSKCLSGKGVECNPQLKEGGKMDYLLHVPRSCGNCLFHTKSGHCQRCQDQSNWQSRPVAPCIKCGHDSRQFHQINGPESPHNCYNCRKGKRCSDEDCHKNNHYRWEPITEKSCSICGHFHAEPRQSIHNQKQVFDGYCDGYNEYMKEEWDWSTYGKDKWARMKTDSCVPFNVKFTPRAAPQPHQYNCMDCEHEMKICNYGKTPRKDCVNQSLYERRHCLMCGQQTIQLDTRNSWCENCNREFDASPEYHDWFYHNKPSGILEDAVILYVKRIHSPAPACARCGSTSDLLPYRIDIGKKEIVPFCTKCVNDPTRIKYMAWSYSYDKETAAGRAWYCDKKDVQTYAIAQILYQQMRDKESDKSMFKCEACGYEDETRKKVKYCPACGVAVEQKNVTHWTPMPEWLKTNESLVKENSALAHELAKSNELLAGMAQLEHNNKTLETNIISANEDIQKLQEKLRRRGVPFNCRRCIRKFEKKGLDYEWPCKWWEARKDDMGYCCSKPHPAKPASLGKIRRKAEKENKSRLKEFNKMWKAMYRIGNYKEESITVGKFQFKRHTTENHWEFTHNDPWEFIGKVKGEDTKFDYPTLLKYKDEFWASLHEYYQNQLAGAA